MILNKYIPRKLLLLCVVFLFFTVTVFSQKNLYALSFEANQGNYDDSYAEYYYKLKQEGDAYRLINKKGKDIFNRTFDTIIKNQYFIKTVQENTISLYKVKNLEHILIPNLKQAYFMRDGLDVLTSDGAQYYDNTVSKIDNFPELELFKCGTVYSKEYSLKYNEKTKKYSVHLSEGPFGAAINETILEFIGIPENIEYISFVSGANYTSESVNNDYEIYSNIIKIVKDGKSGLYSYNIDEAIYPKKKKKVHKPAYEVSKVTGDTIYNVPEIIPISFSKKGTVAVKEVLPIVYDSIKQHPLNGLVYLYKDDKKGLYPNYIQTDFSSLDEKTKSFYSIHKNGKWGWLDLRNYKEYFFSAP